MKAELLIFMVINFKEANFYCLHQTRFLLDLISNEDTFLGSNSQTLILVSEGQNLDLAEELFYENIKFVSLKPNKLLHFLNDNKEDSRNLIFTPNYTEAESVINNLQGENLIQDNTWLIPIDINVTHLHLRLDSQFYQYECDNESEIFKLYETFAVKFVSRKTQLLTLWTQNEGFLLQPEYIWLRRSNLSGVTLVNTVNPWDNFYNRNIEESGKISHYGFFTSVINAIKETTKVDIIYISPDDGAWGLLSENGTWDGLIKDLVTEKADLCACGLTITTERQSAVDFTIGLVEDPLTLMSGAPKGDSMNFYAFLFIFNDLVWIFIFGTSLSLTFGLLIIAKFSPKGEIGNCNPLASVLLSLIQLTTTASRSRKASKVIFINTSLFACLIFAYYNAVLTSLMTTTPPPVKINSFGDVVENDLKVFVWLSSSGEQVLESSTKESPMRKAYAAMLARPENDRYVTNTEDSLAKIANDPKYIMYGGGSGYFAHSDKVSVLTIEETIMTHLAIALRKNSEFKGLFDYLVQKFMLSGLISKMKTKWLHGSTIGNTERVSNHAETLGYENLLFPFMILGCGIMAGILFVLLEFVKRAITITFTDRNI